MSLAPSWSRCLAGENAISEGHFLAEGMSNTFLHFVANNVEI
jgi:hypothetical protein